MRRIIWTVTAVALTASLVASPASMAGESSKEEAIGIGAGGIVGAVAGGPVGFIIGAAIGAKLGDTLHNKDEEIDSLSTTIAARESMIDDLEFDVVALERNIDRVTADLERMQSLSRPELVDLMQAGIAMDVLFRTDEHVLADTTGGRLAELAQAVASMPDIQVRLDGYADERGGTDYNLDLSEKRVQFVRDQLIAAGIAESRIRTSAHGESAAQDDTPDSYALERRVNLTLFIDSTPSFASNPE